MTRILITGAGFENKGAEAMLRTVQAELLKRIPSIEFYVYGISGHNLKNVMASGMTLLRLPFECPDSQWRFFGQRFARGAWSIRENIRAKRLDHIVSIFHRSKRLARACSGYLQRTDCVFDGLIDISGFAYGDPWGLAGFQRISSLAYEFSRQRKPMFFLPQAWGPFEKPEVKQAIHTLLDHPTVRYYSRDEKSSGYLEDVLKKSSGAITSYPDIVFHFQGGTPEQGEHILRSMGCSRKRKIIGIAPNYRVYERTEGHGAGNKYIQAIVKLIKHCLKSHDVDVVLQANEIYEHSGETDDRYLCSTIASLINRPDRCFATRDYLTAEETKVLIGQFDYMIGSRFHSLVFAFSQGIPGMSISWSHKYRELFSLFDMEDQVQEYEEMKEESLIELFEKGWMNRDQQGALISKEVTKVKEKLDVLFDEVAKNINMAQAFTRS